MASVDYYLKIDGIEGESSDKSHAGELEIQSWSWGQTQSGSFSSGSGGGSGKISMQDFHFTMPTNKASPKLFLYCANGKAIDSCKLTCRKAGENQQEYLKITFTNVLISSYQTGGSTGSVLPVDQISFNFSKIELEYSPQKDDGSLDSPITAGWDLQKNAKT